LQVVMRGLAVVAAAWSLALGCGGKSERESHGPGVDDGPTLLGCDYNGTRHGPSDSFLADDGCNTCTCGHYGSFMCTDTAECRCGAEAEEYTAQLMLAKSCDRDDPDACSQRVSAGLACECETFVNAGQTSALAAAEAAKKRYAGLICGAGATCGPCQPPTSGWCNAAGYCSDQYPTNPGAGCLVGGNVYPSGAMGVPTVEGCNTCQCVDGELTLCTLIGCDTNQCPEGTRRAKSCAECGPAGECTIVEHSCHPTCTDRCDDGVCKDGVCVRWCA
jgi:hypothetical protein